MNPFHCSNCNKLLGKIEGRAEIKCPRCKTMNVTRVIMTNLNGDVIICSPEKAEEIQVNQIADTFSNAFDTTKY